MATIAMPGRVEAAAPARPAEPTGVWSWITTVDHKRIGTLYLFTALFFFVVGGTEALVIRLQLMKPNMGIVSADMYNQLFTMHGTTMVFLVIMPLSAAFFNYLIPLQIGARDVAFPRLNAFSYWVYALGGVFITAPIFLSLAPNGGWFGYAPLTTTAYSPTLNIDFWVIGLQILGISSLAAAFNFITTIINMRAPGMHLMRMPIFTWMSFVVQFLVILAFPVITVALVFLLFDRFFGTNFYTIAAGADPLLWQHLFWIFGHPEVYILILPAFGLVSEVLPTYSRKPLFGYPVMVYSGILIGFLGFGVWAHHMFSVGMGPIADSIFSLTTMLIAIPTGVKILNWISTMWGGQIRFTTAMLFGIALVALFTMGGISGIMHSSAAADLQQTDSYFVVAHFHYVLFGGAIFGIFAGVYHYFPKMTGRFLDETLGKWHFWVFFVAMNLTFFPMHFSGLLGMPRRIYTYDAGQGWELFNMMASLGAFLQGAGMLIFFYNMWRSYRQPATAPADPWGAPTLEWTIPSPPPDYNFAKLPQVTSRYPLWDEKGREAMIQHRAGDRIPSAEELHIPMPKSTAKPFVVALFMTCMLASLIFLHVEGMATVGILATIAFALAMVGTLYSWLLSPLE
ncbi:MAG: cytochrome c oxidase subunit I [Gemmatimonadota bacterium]|jgi:cytochrome c oxidase subunit 1|nr:cytochrome c oxidase subunit I [Gemmatimonadota bacterium]